jgi:hypothetical protein
VGVTFQCLLNGFWLSALSRALQTSEQEWITSMLSATIKKIPCQYGTILVIQHIWDKDTAELPKTTDYWKKPEKIKLYCTT